MVDGGGARVEGDRRDARLAYEPVGELKAARVARATARAELDGDGQAGALARGAGDGDGDVGVVEQGGAGAGLADLGDGAAHVQVDGVGARARDRGGGDAHDGGVLAEELDRDDAARRGGATPAGSARGNSPRAPTSRSRGSMRSISTQVRSLWWRMACEETISETAMPAP